MKQFKKYNKLIIIFFIILLILLLLFYYRIHNWRFIGVEGVEGFTEQYTAVIVEPRKHKAMEFVIQNFTQNLPDNWNFIIMHGLTNDVFVKDIVSSLPNKISNRITFVNLGVDNLTIDDYNQLLKNRSFYDKIPTEVFLVFQTDTVICNDYVSLLNRFIKYDYVGAPWEDAVGNGGLSLRRKSKMLEIIDKCPIIDGQNEDIYFANPCNKVSISKPTIDEAKSFSVEKLANPISFGVHKPWAYLSNNDLQIKIEKCTPLQQLVKLNTDT